MGRLGSALFGFAVGEAIDRTKNFKNDKKEWLGQGWAYPLLGLYALIQNGVYHVFKDNEKLATDLALAPPVAMILGLIGGFTIDKLIRNHEIAEKWVMLFAGVGAVAAGTSVAIAANNEWDWSSVVPHGMQSGPLAAPFGEVLVVAPVVVASAGIGVAAGDALNQELLPGRNRD